jgi:hypothetical protein
VCHAYPNLPTIFTKIPTLNLNLNKRPIRKETRNQGIRYVPVCVTFILMAYHARRRGIGFDPRITRRGGWYFNILGLAFANYKILMSDVQD